MVFSHCHAVNEPLIRCHWFWVPSGCAVPFSFECKKQIVSSCVTLVDNMEFMVFELPLDLTPFARSNLDFSIL